MTIPFLAQTPEIEMALKAAEALSQHNDRVLFLTTLILFFIAGGVAVRWFMSQLDKRDVVIGQLNKEIGQVRESFNLYLIAAVKDMSTVIGKNSTVVEDCVNVITRNIEISERKLTVLARIESRLDQIEHHATHPHHAHQ